jgi:CRP-like cAMP-binding protein
LSGKNYTLKPGQILFKEGEKSNGMFLVRKGELQVFVTQGSKEVNLAVVGAGGMIGEMALFDQKPRSASVRAKEECEVSHITNDDFVNLMKQIPKWFVGLMTTLSGRLRTTNDRLQKVEAKSTRPYQGILRILHVLDLVWSVHGEKEGKGSSLGKGIAMDAIRQILPDDYGVFEEVLLTLEESQLITSSKTGRGIALQTQNKGALSRFAEYLAKFVDTHPGVHCLSDDAINILLTIDAHVKKSPYETLQMGFKDLVQAGMDAQYDISQWAAALVLFKDFGDSIQLVKGSDGKPALKVQKDSINKVLEYHQVIRRFAQKKFV